MRPETLISLCRECAAGIYGNRPPTAAYAETVARLLMGTAATESHLIYRRQVGFSLESTRGAWGLWQTEGSAVEDSRSYLRERPDVRVRAACFLFGVERHDMAGLLSMDLHSLLQLLHDWDQLACLFARLHYIRFSAPVPPHLQGQAEYYKCCYNTSAGKGSPYKYINDWRRLVLPKLET